MTTEIGTFVRSIIYCIKIAWRASKLYTIIRLVGNIAIPLLSIAATFVVKEILDNLTLETSASFRRVVLLLLVGLMITFLSLLIQRASSYAQTIHSSIVQQYISVSILEKAMSFDVAMFDDAKFYDRFSAISNDSFSLASIMWSVLECISACVSLACSFAILSQRNVWYAVCIILLIVPATYANHYYTRKLYENDLQQTNNDRKKNYIYSICASKEYASGIRCWNLGDFLKNRYIGLWDLVLQAKRKLSFQQALLVFVLSLLPEVAIFFISIHIVKAVLLQALTIGDYTYYTGIMSQVLSSTMLLISSMITVYGNKLRVDNISAFEHSSVRTVTSGSKHIHKIDSIEFVNVGFSYPETTTQVLSNVNLSINCGEKVALIGKNGSGKSTMIKLLLRLYDTTAGEILINGVDIREYDLVELRNCFGIYFQNSVNFAFTLLENIILDTKTEVGTLDKICQLFRDCDANDILTACNGDLNTYLMRMFSTGGIELSAGQHQKIAIIRALYADSSCLILDEPSSSLDPEAEFTIFESLKKHSIGRITLLTSHRLTNVHLADRIIVLENGKIIEQGTRKELLQNREGRFSELYQYQAQKYAE